MDELRVEDGTDPKVGAITDPKLSTGHHGVPNPWFTVATYDGERSVNRTDGEDGVEEGGRMREGGSEGSFALGLHLHFMDRV